MHVLVIVASEHSSAHEVAETIAYGLGGAGHNVNVVAPAVMEFVGPHDVVVCDSAVCILWRMDEAKSFLERFAEQLKTKCIWAPSVEMNEVSKHASQDPTRIGLALMHVLVIDRHTFVGRYKSSLLSLHERSIARLAGVAEGGFRDWNGIEAWADSIAAELSDKD